MAARKLVASGMKEREIVKVIGVSAPTLYRHLPASTQGCINAENEEQSTNSHRV